VECREFGDGKEGFNLWSLVMEGRGSFVEFGDVREGLNLWSLVMGVHGW